MELENDKGFLHKILIFFISFFLGLFLFVASFIFLYQNEDIKTNISKVDLFYLSKSDDINSDFKIITYEIKKLFSKQKEKDFENSTWILRGIWFFIMWFWLTLFLISFRKNTNKLWFFSLLLSFLSFIFSIFIFKIIIFFSNTKKDLKDSDLGILEMISKFFENLFNKDFWSKLFGFEVDLYFFYFLLFIFFLIIYFIGSHIIKKKPRVQKSSFKKYGK